MTRKKNLEAHDLGLKAVVLSGEGYSHNEIAKKLEKSKSFVTKVLRKYKKTGSIDGIKGSWRLSILSYEDIAFILVKTN
jgi:transposase